MTSNLEAPRAKKIIDAINRFAQLAKLDSKEPNAVAEQAGIETFLKNELFEHAGHLLGCWVAVENEYEPLCNVLAKISYRAQSVRDQRAASEAAARAAEQPAAAEESKVTESNSLAPLPGESNLVAPAGAPLILTPKFRK
jgi:hypothetical protein